MNATNAPGKGMLKFAGLLLLIGAIVSIIMAVMGFLGGAALTAMEYEVDGAAAVGEVTMFAAILALALGLVQLITGILGIKNCDKPHKSKVCIILGIIAVLFALSNLFTGGIVPGIIGLIIPAIYLIGAFRNKAAA